MANSGITDDLRAILAENLTPSGAITTPERLIDRPLNLPKNCVVVSNHPLESFSLALAELSP